MAVTAPRAPATPPDLSVQVKAPRLSAEAETAPPAARAPAVSTAAARVNRRLGLRIENITVPPMSPVEYGRRHAVSFFQTPPGPGAGEGRSGGFDTVTTAGLRLVERPVGGRDQGRGVDAIRGEGGDAQAHGDRPAAGEQLRPLGDAAQRFGKGDGPGLVRVAHQHGELFTADTEGTISRAPRHRLDQSPDLL